MKPNLCSVSLTWSWKPVPTRVAGRIPSQAVVVQPDFEERVLAHLPNPELCLLVGGRVRRDHWIKDVVGSRDQVAA